MTTTVDLESWNRRAHFELFRAYRHPWFNVTLSIDITDALSWCRSGDRSFYAASLYCSTRAGNAVREFRYRIRGHGVVEHSSVHPGCTVLRADNTFAFAYYELSEPFQRFAAHVLAETERVKDTSGIDPSVDRDDLIHHSVLPWIAFSSFQHARRGDPDDSVPKIVFGRHYEAAGRRVLPVSVEVHHALMDGLHVGRFCELLSREFASLPASAATA